MIDAAISSRGDKIVDLARADSEQVTARQGACQADRPHITLIDRFVVARRTCGEVNVREYKHAGERV